MAAKDPCRQPQIIGTYGFVIVVAIWKYLIQQSNQQEATNATRLNYAKHEQT